MSTADRLLSVGEELIATEGVGVSLRAITAEAGSNAAAIHYHFGSKEELVTAIMERRTGDISNLRAQLLAGIEPVGVAPLRQVVIAYIRPLTQISLGEGNQFLRFIAAVWRGGPHWRAVISTSFKAHMAHLDVMLDRALPHLDEELRRFRRNAAAILVMEIMSKPEVEGVPPSWDEDAFETAMVDIVTALLGSPASDPM